MKNKLVIKNTQTRLPFVSTALYSFLMYYFKVDDLWWGVFICFYAIIWASSIYFIVTEKPVDIFDGESIESKIKRLGKK